MCHLTSRVFQDLQKRCTAMLTAISNLALQSGQDKKGRIREKVQAAKAARLPINVAKTAVTTGSRSREELDWYRRRPNTRLGKTSSLGVRIKVLHKRDEEMAAGVGVVIRLNPERPFAL